MTEPASPTVPAEPDAEPEQSDNRPRPEDGEQLPAPEASGDEWTGEAMR